MKAKNAEATTLQSKTPASTQFVNDLPLYVLLLLVFLLGCHEMVETDLWWHLRTGQLILEKRSLPAHDWFTYGNPNARWIDVNWLWQIAAAGLWRLGDLPALIITTSLMGMATFGMILTAKNRGRVSPSLASLLALLPIMLFAQRYPVRPESFAFLLLSASLSVCRVAMQRPKILWFLPVIQILWVNTHGSFILEFLVIGCFAAEALINAFRQIGNVKPQEPSWSTWGLVMGACVLACLVNPYGIYALELVWILQSRLGSGETAQFYKELANELIGYGDLVREEGLAGLHLFGVILVLVTLMLAGSFVGLLWRKKKIRFARVLLAILFAYLGWQARKNMAFFAITALAVTLWNVDDFDELTSAVSAPTKNSLPVLSTVLLLILVVCVPSNVYFERIQMTTLRSDRWKFGFHERPRTSPHAEAKFLGRSGMPKRVFAFSHSLASAYIFHNGPDSKVFVDGRLEVSTRENYERYWMIASLFPAHDPAMEELLLASVPTDAEGKREMPALLLDWKWYAGAIDRFIGHPRWRPVFFGDKGIVFVYELDAERLGLMAVDRDQLRIDILRRFLNNNPDSPKALFNLGEALSRSNPTEATQHFRQAWEIKPNFSEAHSAYATLIADSKPEEAEAHYRIAIHFDPKNVDALFNYANLLLRNAKYKDAIQLYHRALSINPKHEVARQNAALAEERLKQQSTEGRP